MRKTLLLVACVIGSSVFASGQTPTPQNRAIATTAPFRRITANSIERTDHLTFRGSVQMVLDNVTITADEVDARTTPNGAAEYDLRGNVHVTINPR
jgi:hypothetical protein